MSTPLSAAYPVAMQAAQNNGGQVPDPPMQGHHQQGGMPHGPMGGQAAGSMNNQLPIQQMTGREDMSAMSRPVGSPMPQQAPMPGMPGQEFTSGPNFQPNPQQAAQAAAYQQAVRQQQLQQQRAQAEVLMRGIAKEETRSQAVAYIAIGMAVVILAVLVSSNRASLPAMPSLG